MGVVGGGGGFFSILGFLVVGVFLKIKKRSNKFI